MARNWPRLPAYDTRQDAEVATPIGWSALQIESLYTQLPIGKRFEQKGTNDYGIVPVIDQSADGVIGWHNEEPGIQATPDRPVITFANHTCEMRVMRRPFSVIQNVFPLIGRPGVCSSEFLYYATKGRVHLEEYKGHYPDFRRKWIPVPPDPEQRAIARILGALDDKIELNRKMNATLEAMARALFKSWFVDFDPVHAKAEGRAPSGMDADTAKLFPSEFVESELGPIPNGWSPRAVGDLAVLSGGKQLERELIFDTGSIPVFGGAGIMGFTAGHNADGFVISVGRVGAYCGQFFSHRGKAWINNNASLIRPNDERVAEWMFIALKHADIDVIKKGAAQPFVSNGDIANLKLLWPGERTVAAFSSLLVPLLNANARNDAEATALARIRDELLPRLLSGELPVDGAERAVEEVA